MRMCLRQDPAARRLPACGWSLDISGALRLSLYPSLHRNVSGADSARAAFDKVKDKVKDKVTGKTEDDSLIAQTLGWGRPEFPFLIPTDTDQIVNSAP